MRYIVVIIKQLPDNLNSLALLFFWNRLGDNVESMKNLKDVIKYWPKNLKKNQNWIYNGITQEVIWKI